MDKNCSNCAYSRCLKSCPPWPLPGFVSRYCWVESAHVSDEHNCDQWNNKDPHPELEGPHHG